MQTKWLMAHFSICWSKQDGEETFVTSKGDVRIKEKPLFFNIAKLRSKKLFNVLAKTTIKINFSLKIILQLHKKMLIFPPKKSHTMINTLLKLQFLRHYSSGHTPGGFSG